MLSRRVLWGHRGPRISPMTPRAYGRSKLLCTYNVHRLFTLLWQKEPSLGEKH